MGGTPFPGQDGGHPIPGQDGGVPHPRSEWGGTPSQVRMGGTPFPGQNGGYPFPGQNGGYPLLRSGYRGTWGTPLYQQDGVPPIQVPGQNGGGGGHPTGTAWRVLSMRRAVCLLRSRRSCLNKTKIDKDFAKISQGFSKIILNAR